MLSGCSSNGTQEEPWEHQITPVFGDGGFAMNAWVTSVALRDDGNRLLMEFRITMDRLVENTVQWVYINDFDLEFTDNTTIHNIFLSETTTEIVPRNSISIFNPTRSFSIFAHISQRDTADNYIIRLRNTRI